MPGLIKVLACGTSQFAVLATHWLILGAQWLSGRVLDSRRRVAGSSLTGVTALCPCARYINPSLVLVLPSKTRPFKTVRLWMGRKESNQTKKKWLIF